MKTVLVAISGTHGTGKSTQVARCYYLLNRSGFKFSYVRHQSFTQPLDFLLKIGARIVGFVSAEQFQSFKPIRALWASYILFVYYPLLVSGIKLRRFLGYHIVSDRYYYDLLVLFWDNGRRAPLEHLLPRVIPKPDICFVLDADERLILERRPEHTRQFIRTERQLYDRISTAFGMEKIITAESASTTWERIYPKIESTLKERLAGPVSRSI